MATLGTLVLAATLGAAAPAAAHRLTVTPPGQNQPVVVAHHIGQFPPGHHSCGGHTTAMDSESSPVISIMGPPLVACG
jgi:hypothetical protein